MYKWPHGLTLVDTNGDIYRFCSSKCRKNWEIGRRAKKLKWITKRKEAEPVVIEEEEEKSEVPAGKEGKEEGEKKEEKKQEQGKKAEGKK